MCKNFYYPLLFCSFFSLIALTNQAKADYGSDGVTVDELAQVIYAETASIRSKDEDPNTAGAGNIPTTGKDKGEFGGKIAKDLMRQDMAIAILCRVWNNEENGTKKSMGTPPPSPNYDTGSSNTTIATQSSQCQAAAQNAKSYFDSLSEEEKRRICGYWTHYWHEFFTFDENGVTLTEDIPTAAWVTQTRDAGIFVTGLPLQLDPQGGQIMTYFFDTVSEKWFRHAGNTGKVAY